MSPTQAERRRATTALLVRTARELFAARGYPGTSLDDVARADDQPAAARETREEPERLLRALRA